MLQPGAAITTGCESRRQISGRISALRHEIDRLAPFRRFIGAACGNHLADDAGSRSAACCPSDQVETLEALVDEIKRCPPSAKDAVGLGRDEEVRLRHADRRTDGNGGQHPCARLPRDGGQKPSARSQRLSVAGLGRLDREERCLAGASPSQSMATRRTP